MLINLLEKNSKIPMHMPGHKRNTALAPYLKRLCADLDITEIDGFDNLHAPFSILSESMKKAAEQRGAKSAFYLVNGSTCGILSAVTTAVSQGGKVICARNCHKSVYNALELVNADTVFVMPKKGTVLGHISPESVLDAVSKNPDAQLIIITSPTYEGVVSDIEGICRIAHEKNIPVLVDAAHGAHFGFGTFPKSATGCGADIVVESLHKTLPSLTQTAVCYVNGNLVDEKMIADKLSVFETSSPSYILMASIDSCINLLSEKGEELAEEWLLNIKKFKKKCRSLKNLKILKNKGQFFDFDPSKIIIKTHNGAWLMETLRRCGIECEMAAPDYVIAMTGMGDTEQMLSYFASVLCDIDKNAVPIKKQNVCEIETPKKITSVYDAKNSVTEYADYSESVGRVAAEYMWAYPPGIPMVIPGEEIGRKMSGIFTHYVNSGLKLYSQGNSPDGKILVVK